MSYKKLKAGEYVLYAGKIGGEVVGYAIHDSCDKEVATLSGGDAKLFFLYYLYHSHNTGEACKWWMNASQEEKDLLRLTLNLEGKFWN